MSMPKGERSIALMAAQVRVKERKDHENNVKTIAKGLTGRR